MKQSHDDIKDLAEALCKAQAQIQNAKKDATNPHLKSKYADLASVWDACREALTSNGFSVLQPLSGGLEQVTVTTRLLHKSGQWIEEEYSVVPVQKNPQGFGSAATYGRRYALSAMVGVAPDDDDAEGALKRGDNSQPTKQQPQKAAPAQAAPPPPPVETVTKSVDELAREREQAKARSTEMTEIITTIGKIRGDYNLDETEMKEATGLDTMKGLNLEGARDVLQSLMDYCMSKKVGAAVGEPPAHDPSVPEEQAQ